MFCQALSNTQKLLIIGAIVPVPECGHRLDDIGHPNTLAGRSTAGGQVKNFRSDRWDKKI